MFVFYIVQNDDEDDDEAGMQLNFIYFSARLCKSSAFILNIYVQLVNKYVSYKLVVEQKE